ncbi:thiol reductant ABC exporter subunit CydD [Gordonia jinhuaensis]|uniref:Thiol reductant ABC exporter subunit CydD n=1 Tax=Gordonia jinhuaensis TaxID=1517702 RepID=A0A916T738_9ACTN|nr:thiol reductant ABC exporter subunit CydD [Gordonia jinhuaensis]GGB32454.1 thiol reductant ABC exporter subunit CydD [Gordonia jinhuaensis]
MAANVAQGDALGGLDTPASTPARQQPTRRPPLDPRLLRHSRTSRVYLVVTAGSGVLGAITVIVIAAMVASILSELIVDPSARSLSQQSWHIGVLAVAVAVRVIATVIHDRYAHRASAKVIAELRCEAVDKISDPNRTSVRELSSRREHLATVLTRALEALEPYLSEFVPALILTAIVTPAVIVAIGIADIDSAVIVIITLPLIPIFMILIGKMTQDSTRLRLDAMSRLSAQLLDLVSGIPTLRALGRARRPAAKVAELGQAHRKTTMRTLRVAFLSGTVLELLATLSVALVAVTIGLRLVKGEMSLYAGVFALILAPEAYLPLRAVGTQFHNSENGLTAADDVFEIIEAPEDHTTRTRSAAIAGTAVTLLNVGVHGRDRWAPHRLNGVAAPGRLTVITGRNGCGKSTTLQAILGLIPLDEGTILLGDIPVAQFDANSLWEQVAWLPQDPVLVPGTVAQNLELLGPLSRPLAEVAAATGFDEVLDELPSGLDTVLGTGGVGMSAGQRQRLALTRTLACAAPLLLLDEPTAHLDDAHEARVLAALRARALAGDTVVVVSHRPALLTGADEIIDAGGAHVG